MPDFRRVLLTIGIMTATAGQAADQYAALRTNPFIKPGNIADSQSNKTADVPLAADMQLRATVVAGSRSQANIGGVIIGLGEDVDGYRLTEVHARRVVLERDGTRKEIIIDESNETQRN
jgi:hypothetical protein